MDRIIHFYLFLLHRYNEWAINGRQGYHRFVGCAFMGIVLFVNGASVLALLGLIRGQRIELNILPEMQRDPKLFAFSMGYCFLSYIVFLTTGIFERSKRREAMKKYKELGFRDFYAHLYTITSIVLLFILATLDGLGYY